MTRPLTAGKIALMQDTQESTMMDACLIANPTKTTNSYNRTSEAWTWTGLTEKPCGFEANPKPEVLNQVPTSEAVVRLPIGTTVSNEARIRITKRFGTALSPAQTFEVIGLPKQGPSGLRVWLKRVTDGS